MIGNSEYFDLRKDNLYGLIKHDGTEVIEFQWEDMNLNKLSEDLLPVAMGKKWGMIDADGNVIIQPKYLLDSHFVGDFAIVFEGGSYEYGRNCRLISNSNCKIVNKKGHGIVTDCS